MASSLDDFLKQQLGELPPRPARRKKPVQTGVSDQYRRYEQRFNDWACRQLDKWVLRNLSGCAGHVKAAYKTY